MAPLELLCQHEASAGHSWRAARGGAAPGRLKAAHGTRVGVSQPLVGGAGVTGMSSCPAACRKTSTIWVARAAPVDTNAA